MRPTQGFGYSVLAAVCLATSATARSTNSLFQRQSQSTCPVSSQVSCGLAGVPSDFCCPNGQPCVPLAANTTVLCCPQADCTTIKPIPCDIQLQNVTAHPDNTLKTTALNVTLPTCGTSCCPFGYTCNASGNCVMNADQTIKPGATASSAPSPSSTTSPNPASSSTSSTSTPFTAECNKFPVSAVLTGFFPGLALGITITYLYTCFLGKRRQKQRRNRRSGSSFGNISEPQPIGDTRSDFLRKPPATPSSTSPSRRNTISRVRSIFGRSPPTIQNSPPPVAPPIPLNIRRPMAQETRPVTPPLQREPSFGDFGNINIYTDGDTASSLREQERTNGSRHNVRASNLTTVSAFMERSAAVPPAGLQKNAREYSPWL